MVIGEKIKELRQRKGFTQENMSEMLGMSVTNYAYIEQGKVNPNLVRLEQIADTLETNLFELLSLGENDVYYVNSENQKGGSTNGKAYIIDRNLPEDYQNIAQKNQFLEEKIQLLEKRISDLEEMNSILKNK